MSNRRWVDIHGKNKDRGSNTTEPTGMGENNPEALYNEGFNPSKDAVILVSGVNNYGDRIYNYVKLSESNYIKLQDVIASKQKFSMRDYGFIISAGKGMPTKELKAEMASLYNMVSL